MPNTTVAPTTQAPISTPTPDDLRVVLAQSCTIQEAGQLLGVSRRTLYNWMACGKVQYWCTPGGQRRIITRSLYRQADGSLV